MIKIEGVTKEYKTGDSKFFALNNVSAEIKKGEFVSILGPSGSGKSTLMHLIGGLDHPSQGKVVVDDIDLSKANDKKLANYRAEKVGFVFQSFNLLNTSALKNVIIPLVYSKKKFNRTQRGKELLETVGLEQKLKNRPSQMSGGEQQRVSIARALVNDPEIILADEPTGNLDSNNGELIIEILSKLNKDGKTVVVVTHDEELANRTDRIIRIKDGKIQ